MKEIIAFLSPADKIMFENEVPHPTVVCDTFEDFKREIESRDDEYVVKECMLIFSQDVTVAKDCTLNEELLEFVDSRNNFVFRVLDTKANRDLNPEWYSKMSKSEILILNKINVTNRLYETSWVNDEFTGVAHLTIVRSKEAFKDPSWSILTILVKNHSSGNS